jgi:hypothetical protein
MRIQEYTKYAIFSLLMALVLRWRRNNAGSQNEHIIRAGIKNSLTATYLEISSGHNALSLLTLQISADSDGSRKKS